MAAVIGIGLGVLVLGGIGLWWYRRRKSGSSSASKPAGNVGGGSGAPSNKL